MRTSTLFSTSRMLRDAVHDTSKRIIDAIERPIHLVEYITLPDFGQRIVLRFKLTEGHFTSTREADVLESRMRILAGPDYWMTLFASDHKVDGDKLTQRLTEIDHTIPADILHYPPTQHSERIRPDAYAVRSVFNLGRDFLIYEIEVPISDTSEPIIIRVIDTGETGTGLSARRRPASATIDDLQCHTVFFKNNPSFRGCLKAYLTAQQQQRALNNVITQFKRASK